MASEDESLPVEDSGKRRTRSGRKSAASVAAPATPTRSSSRRTKRTNVDLELEFDEDTPTSATSHSKLTGDNNNSNLSVEHHIDSSASSFPDIIGQQQQLDSSLQNTITPPADDGSPDRSTSAAAAATAESIDNLLANLAEDNANSLPSADGDNTVALRALQQHQQQQDSEQHITHKNGTGPSRGGGGAEFLSGSGVGGKRKEERAGHETTNDDTTETSPAASSSSSNSSSSSGDGGVGGGNNSDDIDDDEAIASDIPNHQQSNDSQATLADAEMVSEDESLPASQPIVETAAVVASATSSTSSSSSSASSSSGVSAASIAIVASTVQPVTVDDAEEVSDEELPGPRLAELPADTEVVSEDELPATSTKVKRKADDDEYNPDSPTDEAHDDGEVPQKRLRTDATEKSADSEAGGGFKEPGKLELATTTKVEKKALPELEKYWKAVRDDPADFTGWTYLLQYVDQENDIEAARSAYDAFLNHYPYCYGYWRKYADYEKRKGNKDICEKVFERGLQAIPLSVDLWIHYLTYVKQLHGDNEAAIRVQFEKAIAECGLEFRSDKLWEAYIKWETDAKRTARLVHVYDRLLATPTQGYNGHFDSFQEIVNNNPVTALVSVEEFKRIRAEVRESRNTTADSKKSPSAPATVDVAEANAEKNAAEATDDAVGGPETPENPAEADDHVESEDEATAIKDKILAARRKVHKITVQAVTDRWTFEEGIKRPYFHVKPLERCQLKNWKEYLDFEIAQGDRRRVLVLFERCLIACALYDEFWLKLVRFLEAQRNAAAARSDADDETALTAHIRRVFERACLVHHPDKPALHMLWATFEECNANVDRAAQVLSDLDASSPNLLQVAYRRCNLERRRGELQRCADLYEEYIGGAVRRTAETGKNASNAGQLAIKYARFVHKWRGDLEAAMRVLREQLAREPLNVRVVLQLVDLALQRPRVDCAEVVAVMEAFVSAGADQLELDQRVLFAQRKVEFLEDFGESAVQLQEAQRALQSLMSKAKEAKKKMSEISPTKKPSGKDSALAQQQSYAANSYAIAAAAAAGGSGAAATAGYYGQSFGLQQQQQQAYGDGSFAGYTQQQWQQYGAGGGGASGGAAASGSAGAYGGYSQWSGYGSGGYY